MSSWRLITFSVLLLIVTGVVAFLVFTSSNDDSNRVICLSPEHESQLVDAAVALNLGESVTGVPGELRVDGQQQTVEAWRDNQPEEFDRVCAALADALSRTGGGGGGDGEPLLLSMLTALVPAAAGAYLTVLVTARVDAGGIRRLQAESLRSSSLRFMQAAENYLRKRAAGSPGDPPPVDVLYERRAELVVQLGQILALHPDWTYPVRLRERLQLGADLGGDLVDRPGPIPTDQASRLSEALHTFNDQVEQVALAHSDPRRHHADMRIPVTAQEDDVG